MDLLQDRLFPWIHFSVCLAYFWLEFSSLPFRSPGTDRRKDLLRTGSSRGWMSWFLGFSLHFHFRSVPFRSADMDKKKDLLQDRLFPACTWTCSASCRLSRTARWRSPRLQDRLLARRWCTADEAGASNTLMARLRRTKESVGLLIEDHGAAASWVNGRQNRLI